MLQWLEDHECIDFGRCLQKDISACVEGLLIEHNGAHTANVSQLPVLEDEKFLPPRNFPQAFDCALAKVIDNVSVCFQHTNVVAHFFRQPEQGRCGIDICRHAEIGLFDGDELEQVG